MKVKKTELICQTLNELYPNAKAELNFTNLYELTLAVILSAQTTDKRVNMVTPTLFKKYPDFPSLAQADLEELEEILRSLGMYKVKAKNILLLAQLILDKPLPKSKEELIKLPGIGNKTASVIRIEGFDIPDFPVDTHVERVSKRLGLVKQNLNANQVAVVLKQIFPQEYYKRLHHQMIFFGRYCCHARNPDCQECRLKEICIFE